MLCVKMAKCHVSKYTHIAYEPCDAAKVSPFELQSEFQPNRMCCPQYRHNLSLPTSCHTHTHIHTHHTYIHTYTHHTHTAMPLKFRPNTLLLTEQ